MSTKAGAHQHSITKHGAQTNPVDQYLRATQGIYPITKLVTRKENSTKYLSHREHFNHLSKAIMLNRRNGVKIVRIKAGYQIGQGFAKNSGRSGKQFGSVTKFEPPSGGSPGGFYTSFPEYVRGR